MIRPVGHRGGHLQLLRLPPVVAAVAAGRGGGGGGGEGKIENSAIITTVKVYY